MTELLALLVLVADILVIQDIFRRLRGDVARFLWVVCVVFLPVAGAAFWIYVQYIAPAQKREALEQRRSGRKN